MARASAFLLLLLALSASALVAAASPADAAQKPCWKRLIDDWSNDGQINGSYSARCIDEALARVPEDIRAYSDFEEQARDARQSEGRQLQGNSGGGGGDGGGSGTGGGTPSPVEEREPNTGPKDETPIQSVLGTRGNNADSVPVPLLILLGLAGALITAGAVGFGARKIRARRAAP